MFGYASALIELGYFDGLDINFLIVGHTHSSIDQYFSVLSKAIKSAAFIGSPISLQALCSQAHKDREQPAVNRQIEVCYNIVDALKPYLNKKIKFFQVPHCFSFRRRGNKAIMFYKNFSTDPKWLPEEPNLSTKIIGSSQQQQRSNQLNDDNHEDEIILRALCAPSNRILGIEVGELTSFGGRDAFMKHVGIAGDTNSRTNTYLINNIAARRKVDAIDAIIPVIRDSEVIALHNLETRTEAEEREGHVLEHKELIKARLDKSDRLSIQSAMKAVANADPKKGYIIWILEDENLLPLQSIVPKIIHSGASLKLTYAQEAEYNRLKALLPFSNTAVAVQASSTISVNEVVDISNLVEVPDNDEEEGEGPNIVSSSNAEENQFERTKKSFQTRAKDIVSVAKKALDYMDQSQTSIRLEYVFLPEKLEHDG